MSELLFPVWTPLQIRLSQSECFIPVQQWWLNPGQSEPSLGLSLKPSDVGWDGCCSDGISLEGLRVSFGPIRESPSENEEWPSYLFFWFRLCSIVASGLHPSSEATVSVRWALCTAGVLYDPPLWVLQLHPAFAPSVLGWKQLPTIISLGFSQHATVGTLSLYYILLLSQFVVCILPEFWWIPKNGEVGAICVKLMINASYHIQSLLTKPPESWEETTSVWSCL